MALGHNRVVILLHSQARTKSDLYKRMFLSRFTRRYIQIRPAELPTYPA